MKVPLDLDVTVLILAGGFGRRLRNAVPDRQKVLASVNNRPFICYLFDQIRQSGFNKVTVCTGYKGQEVHETIGERYESLQVFYSCEAEPLGTAGALRLAIEGTGSRWLLVMNGDSYTNIDLGKFLAWHIKKKASISLVVTHSSELARYGSVVLSSEKTVLGFTEKAAETKIEAGFINAGVYLIDRNLACRIPTNTPVSLERDFLPQLINSDSCVYGYLAENEFIDIGTPGSYREAQEFFKNINKNL